MTSQETLTELSRTPPPAGTTQEFYEQLNCILNSASFRDSPSSRRLLEYIATCSLDGREDQLKEFSIGVDVLGRKSDFDPKTDTIVRVQIRRLRQKISQYYETEGIHDRIFLTIPRGRYSAEFSVVPLETHKDSDKTSSSVDPEEDAVGKIAASNKLTEPPASSSKLILPVLWLLLGAAVAFAVAGYWFAHPPAVAIKNDPVEKLWSAMLHGDPAPIIAYPDAVFLLDEASDMFQFAEGPVGARGELVDPNVALKFALNPELVSKAGPLYYENGGYTGTGEIESVAMLTSLLQKLGFQPRVKRSRSITADDLRTHNVILLGGASQNKAVKDFLVPGDFEYASRFGVWGGQIINRHPLPGEQIGYNIERDPVSHVVKTDYALVSCLPSLDALHNIIMIGGNDTIGTEGATSYLTSKTGAETVSKAFHADYQTPYFQAVVKVAITNGDQVFSTTPVIVHGGKQVKR